MHDDDGARLFKRTVGTTVYLDAGFPLSWEKSIEFRHSTAGFTTSRRAWLKTVFHAAHALESHFMVHDEVG